MPKNKPFRTESDFTRKAVDHLRSRYGEDIFCWKSNDNFTRGILDIPACFFGTFVSVELKNGDTAPKPHEKLQEYNGVKIRRAGGFAFIARDMHELIDGFERIREVIGK